MKRRARPKGAQGRLGERVACATPAHQTRAEKSVLLRANIVPVRFQAQLNTVVACASMGGAQGDGAAEGITFHVRALKVRAAADLWCAQRTAQEATQVCEGAASGVLWKCDGYSKAAGSTLLPHTTSAAC